MFRLLLLLMLALLAHAEKTPQEIVDYVYALQKKQLIPDIVIFALGGQSKNGFQPMRFLDIKTYNTIQVATHMECEIPRNMQEVAKDAYFPCVGDAKNNTIDTSWGNVYIYGGEGNDSISSSWGNDFIYPGSGDDVVKAGWGSDVILYFPGWGHDRLDKTCHEATYFRKYSDIEPSNMFYRWEKTNFLVFGGGISQKDIFIENNRLINVKTGDTITTEHFSIEECFNLVFTGD